MNHVETYQRFFAFVFAFLMSSGAFAAIDVSGAETAINDGIDPITSLGTAVLGVLVVAAVFKWVRKVF